MASYTSFLNLEKPTTSERLDVLKINSNWDKIDAGVSALNGQLIEYTTMSNGTNLNSLTAKANYMVGNISQMTGAPTGCGTSGFFYVDIKSSYILQRFFGNLGSAHRFSYDSGSTWTNWFDPNSQLTSTDVITFTATHANISNAERKSVKKFGRVCVIDLAFTVDTDITGDTVELFSGLPKSITGETRFRVPHGYSTTYPPLNLAVTSQGKIINQWSTGGIKAGVWAGEAVYISAE